MQYESMTGNNVACDDDILLERSARFLTFFHIYWKNFANVLIWKQCQLEHLPTGLQSSFLQLLAHTMEDSIKQLNHPICYMTCTMSNLHQNSKQLISSGETRCLTRRDKGSDTLFWTPQGMLSHWHSLHAQDLVCRSTPAYFNCSGTHMG